MKPELKQLIILALGLDAATATDESVEASLTTHLQKIADDKANKEEKKDDPPNEQAQPPPKDKILEDLQAAVKAANDETTAMRETRADLVLDHCILAGIITPASRDTERTTLMAANDASSFTSACDALRTRKPVMQQRPAIAGGVHLYKGELLAANTDEGRARLRREAIQGVMKELTANRPQAAGDYERASAIAADRQPDLFAY